MAEQHISVALSGGGHRACAFALGALLYLSRAGKLPEVASIASVSGGSLANGPIAAQLDLVGAGAGEVETVIERIAARISGSGSLFGARITRAYLVLVILAVPAALGGPWLLDLGLAWRIALFAVALVLLGWLVGMRGRVAGRAFARTLLDGERPRLGELERTVEHVICTTDLHAGEHVYLSPGFVYAFRIGLGGPGQLTLHRAMQASAAFPGAFPAAWIDAGQFAFQGGRPESSGIKRLALHDGGVYDNMADQWAQGLAARNERLGEPRFRTADELVVVSASAGLAWGSVWRLRIPWIGELLTLLKDKSILYDNGNSVRRRELVARFNLADREGQGLRGALVHITQDPFAVIDDFLGSASWPDRAARAKAALEWLDDGTGEPAARGRWKAIARDNAAVPTTLVGLPDETVARLMHHAFVLAAVNLHVILGYSLPDDAKR